MGVSEDNGQGRFAWGRVRVPLLWVALATLLVSATTGLVPYLHAVVVLVVALALYFRLGGPRRRSPVAVALPVLGHWSSLNSPADKVPSHGLHAYGQTFAIDLVKEPRETRSESPEWWPLARRPEEFPAFGAELRAPANGVVVRVHDGERDHWSRSSWPALAYLLVEGCIRELLGPGRLLGNYVVIDIGDGTWAVLAHLQRGSFRVGPGDEVRPGDVIARCGNSGNSSEPHLHFQLMDHPKVVFADGVPFIFAYRGNGGVAFGVPGKKSRFVVAA
jgi:hypothetical protein